MFCSQCGKKVMENMLFCPFCGSPIVIPDQEAQPVEQVKEKVRAAVQEPKQPVQEQEIAEEEEAISAAPAEQEDQGPLNISINWGSDEVVPETDADGESDDDGEPEDISYLFEDDDDEEDEECEAEEFVPLDLEALEVESIEIVSDHGVNSEISELLSSQLEEEEQPKRKLNRSNAKMPARPRPHGNGKNTYVPVKAFDPDDIFLDGGDEEDDYDDYEDEDYDYEEPEYGGFFARHIRGLVALALFVIVLAILAGWAFSDAGQKSLANANLAWRPSVYESMGYEAYQDGNYVLSAGYYEKALARDISNYSYAYSAGIAYYMAEDITRAADMGKKAVEINPSKADAYHLLLRLYPDAVTRPWDVSSLLQKGYQLTGDAALNVES